MQVGASAPTLLATLVLVVLAGCAGDPADDRPDPSSSETRVGGLSTTAPRDSPEIVLDGTLARLPDGFVVNVSAYNAGRDAVGHSRYPFDHPYQPAWSARLSGPPGDGLDYATPGQAETSYPMQTNQPLPPSAYVNWTYSGPTVADCHHRPSCANVWDGDLTLDGDRVPAPAGTYTWRFTFTYSPGQSSSPADRQAQHLDFLVEIPSDA